MSDAKTSPARKPRSRGPRTGAGSPVFKLQAQVAVADPHALLEHAFEVWARNNGGSIVGAPCTVQDAVTVALLLYPDDRPFSEYGVTVLTAGAQVQSPARVDPEYLASLRARYAPESLEGLPYREFEVEIGKDYYHYTTVVVPARSGREAEAEALALLRAREAQPWGSVDEIEDSEFSRCRGERETS